ncbi:MAG: NAD-dependent protein deacetylase [Alphaproteobacteria bacterium MarineAlpha11_Bin1]|nr:MAG: NAD-dependent protein deacetylase [Alphaproteobacteria bacterium MarineAlpha11_Bin1]|tara:strand:- start:6137 stop:6886 length:750 start_codon:yes stop_codon:yes gene_type:complete
MNEEILKLAQLIDASARIVVFTGAGISTESGIPDFRSPNGIWSQTTPIYFEEYIASESARTEAWRRKFEIDRDMIGAEPNRGHRAVAKLVDLGKVSAVITQNIDGLHQESGVSDRQMIELHGNGTYATCLSCAKRHELESIKENFQADSTLPICDHCGGIVKTATISFGQAMPEGPMRRAREETLACDLFLAVGSSLVVYPAAGFPAMAKENGANLVIINREPTDLDCIADIVLNWEIGPTLGEAVNVD